VARSARRPTPWDDAGVLRTIDRLRTRACAVVVAALLVAGCGGSSHSSTTPSAALTAAGAAALAQAINLRQGDVPGLPGTPHVTTAADRLSTAEVAACLGATDPRRRLADVHSDDFTQSRGLELQQAGSSVVVQASAQVAAGDMSAYAGPRAPSCLAAYLVRSLERSASSAPVRYGTPRIGSLAAPAGAGGPTFGYRFAIPATASGVRFTIHSDIQAFQSGPAEVALQTSWIGRPFPVAEERRLLSRLVARARQQHA
jgi:hypothetical protein